MQFTGHSGNDTFNGTDSHDVFTLSSGGNDVANGKAGDDSFQMGDALNAGDRINGGSGNDVLSLNGDYASLVFSAKTMVNVEKLFLAAGHDYNLTTADRTVASGAILTVDAGNLQANHMLTFDGSAELNGQFHIAGGAGNDHLAGGALADDFDLSHGGDDVVNGGGGQDNFNLGGSFTSGDHINGGTGDFDNVNLDGDYSAGLVLEAHMIRHISDVDLADGHDYKLTLAKGSVAASQQQFSVFGAVLTSSSTMNVDTSAISKTSSDLVGGGGNDTLTCGAGADFLEGRHGADLLKGGNGADIYSYQEAADSTGTQFDTITGLDFNADQFFHHGANIAGINDLVSSGMLRSGADFNGDLAVSIGAGQLGPHHAVLFRPDGGTYQGDTFLVVDLNGKAGYQAGHDLVIMLDHATHLADISTMNFTNQS